MCICGNYSVKITEIEIDDSQTGYYWIQIYTGNQKQAISLKHQILSDQEIRERLEKEITRSRNILAHSTTKWKWQFKIFFLKNYY